MDLWPVIVNMEIKMFKIHKRIKVFGWPNKDEILNNDFSECSYSLHALHSV
jgi:hypothetical protein